MQRVLIDLTYGFSPVVLSYSGAGIEKTDAWGHPGLGFYQKKIAQNLFIYLKITYLMSLFPKSNKSFLSHFIISISPSL